MTAALVVTKGPLAGQRLELDGELVIGREGAPVTIEDSELSRRHAAVRPVMGGFEVEDLGSLNGTFVNGNRINVPTRVAWRRLDQGRTERSGARGHTGAPATCRHSPPAHSAAPARPPGSVPPRRRPPGRHADRLRSAERPVRHAAAPESRGRQPWHREPAARAVAPLVGESSSRPPSRWRSTSRTTRPKRLAQGEIQDHGERREHEDPDRRAARLALRVRVEQGELAHRTFAASSSALAGT